MEVDKLSHDEVAYELKIRGYPMSEDFMEMQTLLRGLLKTERGYDVRRTTLDPKLEVDECMMKSRALKEYVDGICGDRMHESYRTADAKMNHLYGRIVRIESEDEDIQKSRSVLLKTILHFMRQMESTVNEFEKASKTSAGVIEKSAELPGGGTVAMIRSTVTVSAESRPDQTTRQEPNSPFGSGVEIFTHQGVALKNYDHLDRVKRKENLPTGILSIVQYKTCKCIEWKYIDLAIESDNTDSEWDVVHAVKGRITTGGSNTHSMARSPVRIPVRELKSYKIKHHGRRISVMTRGGMRYSFLFQCGNGDSFIASLRMISTTKRIGVHKNMYAVIGEREDTNSLNRSFNDLNLNFSTQNEPFVWNFVRNLHNRPYETTMQTFSKLTDVLLYRPPEHRQMDEEVAELLTKSLCHDSPSTADDSYNALGSDYAIVGSPTERITLPERSPITRSVPLNRDTWEGLKDSEGRIIDPYLVKQIVFQGGIEHSLRSTVWKYLLDYYPWDLPTSKQEEWRQKKVSEYHQMKWQWQTITPAQEERFSPFRDRRSIIEKDVNRTDRTLPFYEGDDNPNLSALNDILMTYVMYNFDLGYVQGMSDLLSPILMLFGNEVDTFWCFVGFMNRVYTNFDLDQAGMKLQLSQLLGILRVISPDLAEYLKKHDASNMFFCFRWLLVLFRREFSNEDIMQLWEALWTDFPCQNFHLVLCATLLDSHKAELMQEGNGFTEILKYVNELSMRINVEDALNNATAVCNQLKEAGDAVPLGIRRLIGLAPFENSSNESENSDEDEMSGNESKRSANNCDSMENAFNAAISSNYY